MQIKDDTTIIHPQEGKFSIRGIQASLTVIFTNSFPEVRLRKETEIGLVALAIIVQHSIARNSQER